jgi:hypothetical protein
MHSLLSRCVISLWLVVAASALLAADLGTTGLIDTPTARMRPDGEFSAVISKQPLVDIYSLTYQATPWLETTFRYSAFDYGLYDRSYEIKLRLVRERELMPEISVGVRDILGTGVFGAEYLVANKAFGSLDLSLGIGWGRLADRAVFSNPLAQVTDRFSERDSDVGKGGTVQLDSFFAGPDVGVFGGLSYDLSEYNLRLLAEYNSDNYSRARSTGSVEDPSPISYGVEWEVLPGIKLGGSRQFGEQWAFSIESSLDSMFTPEPYAIMPFISSAELVTAPYGLNLNSWYDRLLYDVERSGLRLHEAKRSADQSEVSLVISNSDYPLMADAIKRALVLAELHLPVSYRSLSLVINENGIHPITINYRRQRTAEGWVQQGASSIDLLAGRELDSPQNLTGFNARKLDFSADIGTRFQFFDPDNPPRYQINLELGASSYLGWGWNLHSLYILDIGNNFDQITRGSDSVLPHVRSDVARYLLEAPSGLEALYLDRQDNFSSEVFYRLYAGVLEEMYSGAGAEVLYQPFRSRLAYGFSANWVKQRDYDKSFNHLDYSTATAFASVYWATPFYNYDIAVHAGRFLAKDLGAKFEIRRTMDNGWSIGAWATLTDVPFEDFGEGSFDKGMYLKIPLQGLRGGANTRSAYNTALRSIQRDGGQMLENFSGRLWHDLRATRYDALDNNRSRMVP